MSVGYQETLFWLSTAGPVLNTFTTAKSILGTTTDAAGAARGTLPAGYFNSGNIGKTLRVTAKGRVSTFTSGTITLDIRFGSVVVWTTPAITPQFSKTDLTWWVEVELVCRSVGPGTLGTVMAIGQLTSEVLASAPAGEANTIMVPATAPAVSSGFDTTAAMTVDMFVANSVSNAANQIQIHTYKVESLN